MTDRSSIPLESNAAPEVCVGNVDGGHEQKHLDESEPAERVKGDREGLQEDDLNIEADEEHRDDEKANRNRAVAWRLPSGFDSTLVRFKLCRVVPFWPGPNARYRPSVCVGVGRLGCRTRRRSDPTSS